MLNSDYKKIFENRPRKLVRVFRFTVTLIIVGLGLIGIIGTGGGSSSGDKGLTTYFRDADGDGYGDADFRLKDSIPPQGYVTDNTDCDDNDAGKHPGVPDIADDGIDQNCDGFDLKTWFQDTDKDGYGDPAVSITANSRPGGYVANGNDCNDGNAGVYPGGCPPPTVFLTVNKIPAAMNGSTPYLSNSEQLVDFTLAVPVSGFIWNVTVECPCGCEKNTLRIWTDPPVSADDNLAGYFQSDNTGEYSWRVDEADAFTKFDALTLNAAIEDACGQQSATSSLTVQTVEITPLQDPFDLQDPWLFVYQRDHYTITTDNGGKTVSSTAVPNGVPDFIEDLWLIGLGTPTPHPTFAAASCVDGDNGNDCLARMILKNTREQTYRLFHCQPDGTRGTEGVNIRFWIEKEAGAPDPLDFAYQTLTGTETEKSFSMMGFGGGDLFNSNVGLSEWVDGNNRRNENNAKKDFGVLTTSLARYIYIYIKNDPGLVFTINMYLDKIFPLTGGKPIGTLEEDAQVIDLSIPDENLSSRALSRRNQMLLLIDLVVEGLSTLAAHEIGHSVGLVAPGHPPGGLFGGEKKAAFIENPDGATESHIDTAGLNIMQPGPDSGVMPDISMDQISNLLTDEPIFFFNELNRAYLQGRVVVVPE